MAWTSGILKLNKIMQLYYRFCSTIHFYFDRKMKIQDPSIFSLLFICLLQVVYLFGGYYTFCLVTEQKMTLNKWYLYLMFAGIVLINYIVVYREAKQYGYYESLLNHYVVIGIIICGYLFMGISGQLYRNYFYSI